jgi:hypothetical protein
VLWSGVRSLGLVLILAACHATATVQNTMPVANMQYYHSVALRSHSSAFASQGMAQFLDQAVQDKLRTSCAFTTVGGANTPSPELVLDLNVVKAGQDTGGFITIQNQIAIETLLVLSDGQTGDLLGTARIQGSSAAMTTNRSNPTSEAIDVVAKTVAQLLVKSGCSGPRISRAPVEVATPNPAVDESHRDEADKLNEDGKQQMFGAHLTEALVLFQQAAALLPDARYVFNVCVVLGAQEKWDDALAQCNKARGLGAKPELAAKIDSRIDALKKHQ